jgi:hypothetical protein
MFVLARDTIRELDHYASLVKEGTSLDEGLRFASFVLNSGLAKLLDEYPSDGPLPVNPRLIRIKAGNLQKAVWRRYEKRDTRPHVEKSDLETLRDDIAALKSHLGIENPPLRVIKGGANESA